MLRDIDADTVDWIPNYDESREEPVVLPARFPNLLVNGSSGIAVGMATNIPPHNLARGYRCHRGPHRRPALSSAPTSCSTCTGPTSPPAASSWATAGIREAYETGRGRIVVRARAHSEPLKQGKAAIIVTEIPYQVNKAQLIEKIAELVREKKISEISDLRDESDRSGMRIVIELKREAIPKVVLNKLYRHTSMQSTFGVINIALVGRRAEDPHAARYPAPLRRPPEGRHRPAHTLRAGQGTEARPHPRGPAGRHLQPGRGHPHHPFERGHRGRQDGPHGPLRPLSEEQAQAIVDLRLRNLTALERHKIEEEHRDLLERIAYLEGILASDALSTI